jgi:hypothetical protein
MDVCFWGFFIIFFSFFHSFFLSFFIYLFLLSFFSLFYPVCAEALSHRLIVKNEVEKACYSIQIKIQGISNWVLVEM